MHNAIKHLHKAIFPMYKAILRPFKAVVRLHKPFAYPNKPFFTLPDAIITLHKPIFHCLVRIGRYNTLSDYHAAAHLMGLSNNNPPLVVNPADDAV
jgi:hypothetical protein